MRSCLVLAVVVTAACSDAEPASGCDVATGTRPTQGPLLDPRALLPDGCVAGGLRDLPGRWFVADRAALFTFSYPRFEGSCTDGFRKTSFQEDLELGDDQRTNHMWSDGTWIMTRAYTRFDQPTGVYEAASAFAACMTSDTTLTAVFARSDTDRGTSMATATGQRFGWKDAEADGLRLVGELAGVAYNLVVDGHHVYAVGPRGLDVIDVADPAAPRLTGHVDGGFNDVRVVRGGGRRVAFLAPLGSAAASTTLVDVTDPTMPVVAGSIPEYSHSVQVVTAGASSYLYLATYTSRIPQYDVTDPLAPRRLGEVALPDTMSRVHDLAIDGDRIYANATQSGMTALDISAGLAAPVAAGHLASSYSHASWVGSPGGKRVVLHGDEGMTATDAGGAFLRVLDGDRASASYMTQLGRYQSRPEVGIHNFELHGDRAYIAYYQDGVRIVDLANPAQPREVAHYNTWDPEASPGATFEGAIGIRVVDGLIYVADSQRGLLILRER
jgi:hypothetical protein